MNTPLRLTLGLLVLTVVAATGCMNSSSPSDSPRNVETPPVVVEAKKKLLAKNIFFETQGGKRRVIVSATVAWREGQFCEFFLCRKDSKEYESVLVADIEPLQVHEALLAAGAKAGSPVQYDPTFLPPQGDKIKVTLRWETNGRQQTVPAQSWLRDTKTHKEMACDWVFAGSRFVENPLDTKRPRDYLANSEGIVLTLANFEGSVLDVSIASAKLRADQEFEAFGEHIPPLGTAVAVILEPVGK